jgi:hypothetical protein
VTTAAWQSWTEANQRYLVAAVTDVRIALEQHVASRDGESTIRPTRDARESPDLEEARRAMPAPPALETLCGAFGLSPFERNLLLLCAGLELDSRFAQLCAAAQRDHDRPYPTFSLALATLAEPHWSAISPGGALRYWRLIQPLGGNVVTTSPLRIDERVLHYLAGVGHLDERVLGVMDPLFAPAKLVPSQMAVVKRVSSNWTRPIDPGPLPVINLHGGDASSRRTIATAICAAAGLQPWTLRAADVPLGAADRSALSRLWDREAVLSAAALVIESDGRGDGQSEESDRAIRPFVDGMRSAVLILARDPFRDGMRSLVRAEVKRPTSAEQHVLWKSALGPLADRLNGELDRVVAHFDLDAHAIGSARAALADVSLDTPRAGSALWECCRAQVRPRLDDLAQRIEPAASWDDLVVPDAARHTLREIAVHMRHRTTVYQRWGFARKGRRGLGVSALFVGPSGTGKTMAAEVLAGDLELDLYRIDLSSVVSKYIGETEKNLRRVFDAAEEGGAILLFDEADALFGKRSDVKDSHDRYANIEVSYLLQRMEAYRGMSILTTNLKTALDTSFLRRLRFVVPFPFPDAAQRLEIWRRAFPPETPVDGTDLSKLSRLNVAGGSIRNIALNAAFLAAEDDTPVGMRHLLRATRTEYAKLERSLTETEIAGWA